MCKSIKSKSLNHYVKENVPSIKVNAFLMHNLIVVLN